MGMIPIINSEFTRVTRQTKNLFVEVTGMSKNGVDQAARMLACSFIDMGAKVLSLHCKYSAREEVTRQTWSTEKSKSGYPRYSGRSVWRWSRTRVVGLANRMGHVSAKYGKITACTGRAVQGGRAERAGYHRGHCDSLRL